MRKAAICVLAAALMIGCGSMHTKRYFQIMSLPSAEPALPKIERRLLVEPPAVDPLYDDIRILYRVSPFELKYYPYEFWAEKPGKQIGSAIADYLAGKKVFPWVDRTPSKEATDLLLRSRVHIIEEIDNPDLWLGRLAMDIEFVDFKTGGTLVYWTFDRKSQIGGKLVGNLPAVLSRILEEELAKAVWELAHTLEKKGG
jgi:ABC-type uncharacterized transport system auxiliary subunit